MPEMKKIEGPMGPSQGEADDRTNVRQSVFLSVAGRLPESIV